MPGRDPGLPVAARLEDSRSGGRRTSLTEPAVLSTESTPSFKASTEQAGGAHHRLFTWRNAILGGVAAFALLGVVTASYMAMRTFGIGPAGTLVARGLIDERAPILLAEFESGDSLLSRAATDERFVALPVMVRAIGSDEKFLAPSLERLGQLYDERGDWEKAAEYYARFVELWREADPELQPRVEAAQERLEEIFAERS